MKDVPGREADHDSYTAERRSSKPRVGISACLLGEPVRYDGGHRRDGLLLEILGPIVEWVPICPEVECGLAPPRSSMDLMGDPESPRLVSKTGEDHTRRMTTWSLRRLRGLRRENLCGFIFKSRSPSCGIRGVPVYDQSGSERQVGIGMFARAFMERFPSLPIADEESLQDPCVRQSFIESVSRLGQHRFGLNSEGGPSPACGGEMRGNGVNSR